MWKVAVKTKIATCGALALAGVFSAGVSGCGVKVGEISLPKYMSVGDLQSNVANGLARAGSPPQSVTCRDGLVAGKTTSCDVVFSDTNDMEAIATATGSGNSDITYDLAPAMSKEQVEKAVAAIAAVPSATCDSGLTGTVGAATRCEIHPAAMDPADPAMDPMPAPPVPIRRVAEVARVDPAKLGMELSVFALVPKQQVQDMLWQRLFDDGLPAETVECADDVAGKVGGTVECVAVSGDQRLGYQVTVVQAEGDNVSIDYKAKP